MIVVVLLAAAVTLLALLNVGVVVLLVVYALPEKASAKKFRGDRIDMDVARWELLTLNDDLMSRLPTRDRQAINAFVAGSDAHQADSKEDCSKLYAHPSMFVSGSDSA